ncbi:hypothetical protein TorRG33x02_176300 [Trema orientale]|uniref:Uncharacterized protein n=1 Tax=Trema orientale TaxID=63057 RepID=A0A2P5EM64_TREOI|nr:hypothetical protein TorRG33x02_176300 [Trema orientale]
MRASGGNKALAFLKWWAILGKGRGRFEVMAQAHVTRDPFNSEGKIAVPRPSNARELLHST